MTSASFGFSQVERSHGLSLAYELFALREHTNPERRPVASGNLGAVTLAYSFSDARRFVRSVSSEEGQRFGVTLRLSDPAVGSDFSYWQLSAAISRYLRLPWALDGRNLHHALALRVSAGRSSGDLSRRHLFFLGGFQQGDLVRSVISPTTAPQRVLRGFSRDAFDGDTYFLGSLEYRFPLLSIETGVWTLPLYLRRLHAAVYSDVGDAWTVGARDFQLHAGAGAELRVEVVLGYILPTDLRLGCARGLEASRGDGTGAILDCYAALGGEF